MKKSSKAILVIDDDAGFLGEVYELLSEKYSDVLTCSDPEQALVLIRDYSPKLIILDLGMPFLKGEDLLRLIHTKHPKIPIMICTGMPNAETQYLLHAGAFAVFQKPFSYTSFFQTLEKAA